MKSWNLHLFQHVGYKKKKKRMGCLAGSFVCFEEEKWWNHRPGENWNGEGHLISVLGSDPS